MFSRNASAQPYHFNRIFFAALIFVAAYMTTISVKAQDVAVHGGDAIQLNANSHAVITGTVISADENFVMIDSAGKELKIILDRVDLTSPADEMFRKGMVVSVDGKMKGDDFGTPIVEAYSITASEGVVVTP